MVIHTPDQQVLLIERARHPGFWQSVTGSIEPGEPLQQTAQREVREETGLDYPLTAFRDWHQQNTFEIRNEWRHRYAPDVTHNTEHVFSLCVPAVTEITLSPTEHRAYRWMPLAEAAQQCFSESNREAILALPAQP